MDGYLAGSLFVVALAFAAIAFTAALMAGIRWVGRASQRPGASRLVRFLERVRKALAYEP